MGEEIAKEFGAAAGGNCVTEGAMVAGTAWEEAGLTAADHHAMIARARTIDNQSTNRRAPYGNDDLHHTMSQSTPKHCRSYPTRRSL